MRPCGAHDETALQEVGLVDVLERGGILPYGARQRTETNRTAAERLGERFQDADVHPIEAEFIDLEELEGLASGLEVDGAAAAHLRVVAYTFEQAVCQARGTT